MPVLLKWLMPSLHLWALETPYYFTHKAGVKVMPADNEPSKVIVKTILDPLLEEVRVVNTHRFGFGKGCGWLVAFSIMLM